MTTRGWLLLIAAAAILWYARLAVMLVFAAILLALVLHAAVDWLAKKLRLPRVGALIVVTGFVVAVIGAAIWFAGDSVVDQIEALKSAFPQAVAALAARLDQTEWGRWIAGMIAASTSSFGNAFAMLARAGGIVSSALGALLATAFVLFVAVCLTLEPELYLGGALQLLPISARARIRALLYEIATSLRAWLVARLIAMVALGILVTLGLTLLHVPLALLLGLLAGLLAFIPNVGAIAAAIPALLIAFAASPERALFVALMYWLAHFLEDFFVGPIAERQVVKLPPALTVTVQLVLAAPLGVLGIMLAAPLVATALVAVRRLWVEAFTETS